MTFPWGQPITSIKTYCAHCGKELVQEGSMVIECHCAEAEQSRAVERERQRRWQTFRKPTFDEARRRNKRPLRD